jgi:hypothetical protein
MEKTGTYVQALVDGKLISSFSYNCGEYHVTDSAIGDIRIIPCMRDLAARSDEMTVLVVRLESEQLGWESDIPQMFFLNPSEGDENYRIIFSLKTALSSQRNSTSSIIEPLLINTPYSLADIQPEPSLESPHLDENNCHT